MWISLLFFTVLFAPIAYADDVIRFSDLPANPFIDTTPTQHRVQPTDCEQADTIFGPVPTLHCLSEALALTTGRVATRLPFLTTLVESELGTVERDYSFAQREEVQSSSISSITSSEILQSSSSTSTSVSREVFSSAPSTWIYVPQPAASSPAYTETHYIHVPQ